MQNKKVIYVLFNLLLIINIVLSQNIFEIVENGDLQQLKNIVTEQSELLDLTNDNEKTCLHFAATSGFNEIVELLIDKGADVNCKNIAGETPLHYAAAFGYNDIIKTLLLNGADINSENNDLVTPLHNATFADINTVNLLIKNGAEVNSVDVRNYTPLDYADMLNKQDMVQLLVSNGCIYGEIKDTEIEQVSEKIHWITFPYCERSNIAVLNGSDGLILVDTGCSSKLIDPLKKYLNNFKNNDIKYIINTHLHPDHIAGNSIGGDTIPIINYQNLQNMVTDNILSLDSNINSSSNDEAFAEVYSLHFNGEKILLIPYPGIHTIDDIIVYFPGEGVVHTGDLFISQSFPSVVQNVNGYLHLLDKMIDIFPKSTIFIGGHGRNATYEDLVKYDSMLIKINDVVLQKLDEGKTVKEIRKVCELQGYEQWRIFLPELNINYWINAIIRNYNAEKKRK